MFALAAILFALVLYTGTFITEIVRGSIQSLPKGQTEAAQALGLSNYQRITLIILGHNFHLGHLYDYFGYLANTSCQDLAKF